ncbi:MAG: 30S ribosomal protein S8 [Polyangiaceae bacterium]|nr:30S ribosomal protein S8 [Polyangiaceae bacterium]
MNTTDPIADLLARIRNAALARHDVTRVPASKVKKAIAEIMKHEGFIADVREEEWGANKHRSLAITLKYTHRRAAFMGMRRVSRPGRRVYVGHDEIPRVLSGLGVSILSTSQGVLSDREARKRRIGGELLCEVW